jgi:ABC-type Fe3+-citrate transport system substrate-binding protein
MIKNYLFIIVLILLANCSLNSNSKNWTENSVEDTKSKEMIEKN